MTQRQNELLTFIGRYTAEHAFAPSFEEMRAALRLASKSGVHRLVNDLVDRGLLEREGRGSVRAFRLAEPLAGSIAAHSTDALKAELHRRGFTVTADFPVRP